MRVATPVKTDESPRPDPVPTPGPPAAVTTAPYLDTRNPISVHDVVDGGMEVTFYVDAVTAKRLKLKAGARPVDRHIWELIIRPAVNGAAY